VDLSAANAATEKDVITAAVATISKALARECVVIANPPKMNAFS
jgi:hypothetical protein